MNNDDWLMEQMMKATKFEKCEKLLLRIIENDNDKDSDFHPAISNWAKEAKEILEG
jgi:hypothetical protein